MRLRLGPAVRSLLRRALTDGAVSAWVGGITSAEGFTCLAPTRTRVSRQPCDLQEIPYRNRFSKARAAYILARMQVLDNTVIETLNTRFRRAIAAYCARQGLSARALGVAALGDPGFVSSLDGGRNPRLSTVDRVLALMGDIPLSTAFRKEVDGFLTVTGIKRSVFGGRAAGNPSFVAAFRRGVSPKLSTVERVRVWMAAHASEAEARELDRRRVRMPALLTEGAARTAVGPLTADPRPEFDCRTRTGRGGILSVLLNTREAADRVGMSPGTLASYRVRGGGPVYMRLGGSVRYRIEDLDAWAAGRRGRRRSRNTGTHSSAY